MATTQAPSLLHLDRWSRRLRIASLYSRHYLQGNTGKGKQWFLHLSFI